jgi:lysophospholipase L1-like esterase
VAVPTEARGWSRYVAIGDSLTEGLADPDPRGPDRWIGWADRLAVKLAAAAAADGRSFGYANLAVRGRLMADVAGRQVDAALALKPDLVAVWGGGNDCLRPNLVPAQVAARLETGVSRLRAAGADVLLLTAYDASDSAVLRWTAGKSRLLTDELWRIADHYGCYVADVWNFPALHDLRLWADDLIHLRADGHARLAERAAAALGLPAAPGYEAPLPPAPPRGPLRWTRDTIRWSQIFLFPWVRRRIAGRSTGDGRVGKRLTLEPVDDVVAALAAADPGEANG